MLTSYKNQKVLGNITLYTNIVDILDFDILYIKTLYEKEKCTLKIGNKVLYIINSRDNSIEATACNLNWLESTLLNLPFAILFSFKDMLLLHASSLISKGNIIPLCAPKGTGKTTISLGLSKYYSFYSDDTLLIGLESGKLQGYFGTRWVKLNKDSFDLLNVKQDYNSLKKNVQGKVYCYLHCDENDEPGVFDKMFFLNREGQEVKSDIMSQPFLRKISLHKNICGSTTLGYEYCRIIENTRVFCCILNNAKFIKLTITDNKELISNTVQNVKLVIENCMK